MEPGAVVCRVARCFVRFGSFQVRSGRLRWTGGRVGNVKCTGLTKHVAAAVMRLPTSLAAAACCAWRPPNGRSSAAAVRAHLTFSSACLPQCLQLPAARGGEELGMVRQLADYVIRHHYPHLQGQGL